MVEACREAYVRIAQAVEADEATGRYAAVEEPETEWDELIFGM